MLLTVHENTRFAEVTTLAYGFPKPIYLGRNNESSKWYAHHDKYVKANILPRPSTLRARLWAYFKTKRASLVYPRIDIVRY